MTIKIFFDSSIDAARSFNEWRDRNPNGYYANDKGRTARCYLHRSTCDHMVFHDPETRTAKSRKACSLDLAEVQEWIERNSGPLKLCADCDPMGAQAQSGARHPEPVLARRTASSAGEGETWRSQGERNEGREGFRWDSDQLVRTSSDVRETVIAFNTPASADAVQHLRRTLASSRYWVYDGQTGQFAPSKFTGVRQMTHERYSEGLALALDRGSLPGFDGYSSRVAIQAATGSSFVHSLDLSGRLKKWAIALLGEDPFAAIDESKWRFLTLSWDESTESSSRNSASGDDIEAMLGRLSELDATRSAAVRLEQSILRSHIFGGRDTGTCALCGDEFPISLMVAAHIKRRANCNDEEKRDRNVVMPVCTFGCDELFERGYVVVVNGRVADGPVRTTTAAVVRRVSFLRGKPCTAWNDRTVSYFAHRRESGASGNI